MLFVTGRRGRAKACWCGREPSIGEILAEPIVRAVMKADGVAPRELAAILDNVRETLLNRSRRDNVAPDSFLSRSDTNLRRGPSTSEEDGAIMSLKEAYLLGIYDAELAIDELRSSHHFSTLETMHLMREWDDERLRRNARRSSK
jgi:hypothetical protein